ncbi:MAG: hypothetical protein LAT51_06215 [Flavobacteriaceae bacterium]|nr:hypothetical protein [Flavobacteriaceae bacterium]
MSFTKAVVRQVGRDLGKVVSNKVFGDRHSTPYRRVGSNASSGSRQQRQQQRQQPSQQAQQQVSSRQEVQEQKITSNEFDKAIGFATTFTAPTMVRKLAGVYEVMKNEIHKAKQDGYLDTDESTMVFKMESEFMHKAEIITDLLELEEEKNKSHLEKLQKIVELTQRLIKEAIELSLKGAKIQKQYYENQKDQYHAPDFKRYAGFGTIWMLNYARTGEKNLLNTIVANAISLFAVVAEPAFLVIYLVSFFIAVGKFSKDKNTNQQMLELIDREIEIEEQRIKLFEGMKMDSDELIE